MSSSTELEHAWLIRASLAKQRYEEASRDFIQLVGDLKNRRSSTLGCSEELREARQRESLALNQYLRAIRIYTDLVLKGMVPEESHSNNNRTGERRKPG